MKALTECYKMRKWITDRILQIWKKIGPEGPNCHPRVKVNSHQGQHAMCSPEPIFALTIAASSSNESPNKTEHNEHTHY
jgi:hypothetical protein